MTALPANITSIPAGNMVPLPAMPRGSVLANPEQFKINLKAAEYFAASDLVPGHYRNKPANCFLAINAAQRLGVDEFYFLQKTFVIGGKMGLAAELAIELANSSGRFRGPIRFRLHGEGESRACTASAVLLGGDTVENTVSYAMAKADGWTSNKKWQSLTDQMLQYRAGVFLARLYAGGAMGGMYSREELEDIAAATARDVTPEVQAERVRPPRAVAPPGPEAPAAKPPLLVNLPDGWEPARFPRSGKGLREALEFLAGAVLDGSPVVVGMNNDLLDTIAEKIPALADEVANLRAAAAEAMSPKDDLEPGGESDGFVQEFLGDDTFPGDMPSGS